MAATEPPTITIRAVVCEACGGLGEVPYAVVDAFMNAMYVVCSTCDGKGTVWPDWALMAVSAVPSDLEGDAQRTLNALHAAQKEAERGE